MLVYVVESTCKPLTVTARLPVRAYGPCGVRGPLAVSLVRSRSTPANKGLRQPNESIRCGTVCSKIVYSVRIGPPQPQLLCFQLFRDTPQPSELTTPRPRNRAAHRSHNSERKRKDYGTVGETAILYTSIYHLPCRKSQFRVTPLPPFHLTACPGWGTSTSCACVGRLGTSQPKRNVALKAPASCAMMNSGASAGRIPANVSDNDLAMVTAGLANDVDAVNQ